MSFFCFAHYSYQQKNPKIKKTDHDANTCKVFPPTYVQYVWHNIHLNQWLMHQKQFIVIFLPSVLPPHMTRSCLQCGCYKACCWMCKPIIAVFILTSLREHHVTFTWLYKGCPQIKTNYNFSFILLPANTYPVIEYPTAL